MRRHSCFSMLGIGIAGGAVVQRTRAWIEYGVAPNVVQGVGVPGAIGRGAYRAIVAAVDRLRDVGPFLVVELGSASMRAITRAT